MGFGNYDAWKLRSPDLSPEAFEQLDIDEAFE